MPRFTLKDLLWAVTLIGLGVGGICYVNPSSPVDSSSARPWSILGIASVAAIGAGAGAFFQRKKLGVTLFTAFALIFGSLGVVGDGWPSVSVSVKNSTSQSIQSVMCQASSNREEAELLASRQLPPSDRCRTAIADPFSGQSLTVNVAVSEHSNWIHHFRVQQRWLVVVASFDDGNAIGKVVTAPDLHVSDSITVEFP